MSALPGDNTAWTDDSKGVGVVNYPTPAVIYTPPQETIKVPSNWYYTETKTGIETIGEENAKIFQMYVLDGWQQDGDATENTTDGVVTSRKVNLKRRRVQNEKVLKDMLEAYVAQMNDANAENIARYNNIVSMYGTMLADTISVLNSVEDTGAGLHAASADSINYVAEKINEHRVEVEGVVDNFGDAQRDRINTQFNNLLTELEQKRISEGRNSSTVAASEITNVERERAKALTELEERILSDKLSRLEGLLNNDRGLADMLIGTYDRLRQAYHSHHMEMLATRNMAVQVLGGFIERRNDVGPTTDIAQIAATLGKGDTAGQSADVT